MQSKPTPSGVDRFSASLNASALPWASGLGKLTSTPTRSSRAGVSCLACFQKQLFAMWMWRMYWISLHTLIDSRLFAWDVSADHQPLSARPHQPGCEHSLTHSEPRSAPLAEMPILFSWRLWESLSSRRCYIYTRWDNDQERILKTIFFSQFNHF